MNAPGLRLKQLRDVLDTDPTDGQILTYNAAQGKWLPANASASTTLDGLTDVTLTSPSNGQLLAYDSGTSQWVNQNAAGTLTTFGPVGVSGQITLTTSEQDIPGLTLSLNTGTYLVGLNLSLNLASGDAAFQIFINLSVAGTPSTVIMLAAPSISQNYFPVHTTKLVTVSGTGVTVKATAKKGGGSGSSATTTDPAYNRMYAIKLA